MDIAHGPRTFKQGRYEVKEVLGRGLFSAVYKVYDTEDDKTYALKALGLADHDRDIAEAMFNKEVDALSGFKNDGVVQMVDHFVETKSGGLCIVLELIPRAATLETIIREVQDGIREKLAVSWCLEQLQQLITVLDQAHNRHVVHRDVKPANLLVGQRAGKTFMKLADFGIARIVEHYGRDKGMTLPQFATVPYAPQEQVKLLETTAASDYYAFGVTMVALLTWQLPRGSLEGEVLEHFLEPLEKVFSDSESYRIIESLARGLLHSEPQERPRPTTVKRSLENVLNRLTTKPQVGFKVTESVRVKIERYGMTVPQFFQDLNDYPVAEYQENERDGEKRKNVVFHGRSVMALSVTDFNDDEQLVLVDARIEQPDFHRRRRESDTVHICPYELIEGKGSAYDLLTEFYDYFLFDRSSKQRYQDKEDMLEAGLFVLSQLENDAVDLIITYRQRSKQSDDDILTVEVVNVISSDENGLETIEALDDELISEWISALGESTSFGLQRQGKKRITTVGTLRNYNRYTRELSLRTNYQGTMPPQGRLICQNVAQLSSNKRQRDAVDRFLADNTVNQQLGELLLKPGINSVGARKPRQLIQRLEPQQTTLSIIERALAAEDFFLVQGPPGTGKTTLIAEFVMQVLKEKPEARILLTSQANPAVDNAMSRIRDLSESYDFQLRTLRLTRTQLRHGTNEFEDFFSTWIDETREASQQGLTEVLRNLETSEQNKVRSAVENWQEKLSWAEDVRKDYAQSVQVYGVTCLRAPTLWELLRKVEFDWVIVDEAAKATDTEVLVPLVHGKRFLMVGDQRQLPPFVDTEIERAMRSQGIDKEEARSSLFEKTFDSLPPSNKAVLRRQYRMHSSIGDFVGRLFYADIGGLETGIADEERQLNIDYLKSYKHRVLWFDVASGEEEQQRGGTSFYNRSEANRINKILEMFNENLARKGVFYTVGVITPYTAQVNVLLESLDLLQKSRAELQARIDEPGDELEA